MGYDGQQSLFHELMQIGRHRNLAFFGRVPSVDKVIIEQTRAALARIQAPVPPRAVSQ